MSKTGILTEKEVTDEYIMLLWGKNTTDYIFSKFDAEQRSRIFEKKRAEIIQNSMKPQVLIDLEGWEFTDEYAKLEGVLLSQSLMSMYPDHIKTRIDTIDSISGQVQGKDKAYLIYMYEKYTDLKQNELCVMAGLTPRHYRDLRSVHSESFDEMICDESFYREVSEDLNEKFQDNVRALSKFIDHLKHMGVNGVDEWGDYEPIDNSITRIIESIRAYSGECTNNIDDWSSLKTFEWYITLSREGREGYGIKP